MEFSKEYIKECDCEEIQNLKNGQIIKGDWFIEEAGYPDTARNQSFIGNGVFWLPTGDQLDEEIVKIIEKEIRDNNYEIYLLYRTEYKDKDYLVEILYPDDFERVNSQSNSNPLIAKIKLLKQLLNEVNK